MKGSFRQQRYKYLVLKFIPAIFFKRKIRYQAVFLLFLFSKDRVQRF